MPRVRTDVALSEDKHRKLAVRAKPQPHMKPAAKAAVLPAGGKPLKPAEAPAAKLALKTIRKLASERAPSTGAFLRRSTRHFS